jgi:hypothetical protein
MASSFYSEKTKNKEKQRNKQLLNEAQLPMSFPRGIANYLLFFLIAQNS